MSNAYIEWYLKNQYNNNFSNAMDEDYEKRQYPLAYSYQDFVHTNGFFDFSKDTLALSGDDMVQYLNDKYLANVMFGSSMQNNTRRKEWQQHFEKTLYNNFDLYKQCIKVCLNEHLRKKQVNTDDPIILQHIESFKEDNRKAFEKLVFIGKSANYFNHLNPSSITNDELFTENREYQQFLEQQNIFDSEFKIDKLIEVYKSQEGDLIKKFISASRIDLYDQLLKDNTLITKLVNLDCGYNGVNAFNNLVHIIIENNFGLDQESHSNFIKNLLTNSDVYTSTLKNKNFNALLDKHPKLFAEVLENFNETEKFDFYYTKHSYDHSATPSIFGPSKSVSVIKHMLKEITNLNYYPIEVLNTLYEDTLKYTFIDPQPMTKRVELNNFMTKNVFEFITCFKDYASTEQNLYRNAVVEQYVPIIIENFDINSEVTIGIGNHIADILKLKETLMLFPANLQAKQLKKLNNKVQMQIYQYFNKEDIDISNPTFSNGYNNRIIERLPVFLSTFDAYEVLDVLNADNQDPLWKKIRLNTTESYRNIKKQLKYTYINELPLAFYLIEKTEGDALTWFINESNLEHIVEQKHENKTLLGYFKNNSKIFENIVKQILQDEDGFNTLIKPQKSILKHVSEIDNHEIQSSMKYYLLNAKVNKKVKKPVEEIGEVKKKKI